MTAPRYTPEEARTLTLERLLSRAAQAARRDGGEDPDPGEMQSAEGAAVRAARALLTPQARLELAADLLASLPRGHVVTLSLGSSAAALEWLLVLGAAKEATPHVLIDGPAIIESAKLQVGQLVVTAQCSRPMVPADLLQK